jgi:general secretion pathway protein F
MRFHVKAVAAGAIVQTLIEAPDALEATRLAERQGMKVLSLRGERELSVPPFLAQLTKRKRAFPLLLFSQELATLLAAGLSLIDALESLRDQDDDESTRRVLDGVVRLLYEGKSLSQSLGKFPNEFPEVFAALVQSSEKTGSVGEALKRYVAYRQRIDLVRHKIIGASVYPLLLFAVGGAVLLFLLGYVVPRFSVVLTETGVQLPWLSRALLGLGQQIHDHHDAFLAMLALSFAAAALALRAPAVRAALGNAAQSVPAIRQRIFLYQMARLYRSLGILLQGGIPILTAIGMTKGLVGLASRARLEQAGESVRQGIALSQALADAGLSTPVAQRMLRAGEQAGNLGEMLERTADFHDEEIGRWMEWFVRLFEPLLMVFVGGVIGIIVILMYIPIFELAGSLQ